MHKFKRTFNSTKDFFLNLFYYLNRCSLKLLRCTHSSCCIGSGESTYTLQIPGFEVSPQ